MSRHPLYGHPDLREVAVPVATVWTSPEAPRELDEPAVADVPDMAAWTAALDGGSGQEHRLDLHGRTLTQLLLGEPALVLEERDGWSRLAALWQTSSAHEHGYPGWVRTAHLGAPVDRTTGVSATVVLPAASCATDAGTVEVSLGTGLWVGSVHERTVEVLLPGGRRGALPLEAVTLGHKNQQQRYGPDDVLAVAAQFVGKQYLWGGTSGWGVDCSGLVHLAFRAHGVLLSRDAFDQAASPEVRPVSLDAVQPGDLYFFAEPGRKVTHVGFVSHPVQPDGTRWMLHAPEGGGLVENATMTADRMSTLVGAGRVRKPDAGQLPRWVSDEGTDDLSPR